MRINVVNGIFLLTEHTEFTDKISGTEYTDNKEI